MTATVSAIALGLAPALAHGIAALVAALEGRGQRVEGRGQRVYVFRWLSKQAIATYSTRETATDCLPMEQR